MKGPDKEDIKVDDTQIIDLYFARSEEAILQTQKKYGRYCYVIANNILESDSDSQECVNDTYLKMWETIPPKRPERLSVYIGKLVRNLSISKFRGNNAAKRSIGAGLVYEELDEMIPDPVADIGDTFALKSAINNFLKNQGFGGP